MPIKIAIDALAMGVPPQGIGIYAVNIIRALSRIDFAGLMEISAYVPAGAMRFFEGLGTDAVRLIPCSVSPSLRQRIPFQHLILPAIIRRAGADIVHSPANILPAAWRGPSVLTAHDLDFAEHPMNSSFSRRLFFKALTPRSFRRAAKIITGSHYSAGVIAKHYPWLDPGKIAVIPYGCPAPRSFSEDERRAARLKHGLAAEYFICLGTVESRKNLVAAMEAFSRLRREMDRPVDLAVIGPPGFGYRSIVAYASSLPYDRSVRFLDFVDRDDVDALLAGALGLVLVSESEGFGFPALEAMACRCPVIAARAGALPETCGRGALLVNPGNIAEVASAMGAIMTDAARAEALRESGLNNLERFSWPRHAALLSAIYRETAELRRS